MTVGKRQKEDTQRDRDRDRDKGTDRGTDRKTDRQTDRQTEKLTDEANLTCKYSLLVHVIGCYGGIKSAVRGKGSLCEYQYSQFDKFRTTT